MTKTHSGNEMLPICRKLGAVLRSYKVYVSGVLVAWRCFKVGYGGDGELVQDHSLGLLLLLTQRRRD
jgi:hypothetical protein